MLGDNGVAVLVGRGGRAGAGRRSRHPDRAGSARYSTLPAVAGYSHLVVPMGEVQGLPVGLSIIGPAWSEARLLAAGFAFEQATHARRPPQFLPALAARPGVAKAYDP